MYAMLGTRPDLAYAVGKLSQFSSKPDPSHFAALKRVFRYLNGTVSLALKYSPDTTQAFQLHGYSDADWAGEKSDRRSTRGYLFYVNNCLISWSSKRQPTVALSSCEAEYMALTQAAKETIWLRQLLSEINFPQIDSTIISEDNKSAIALAYDPAFHARVKHIEIQHHFIREKIESKEISLQHVTSEEMKADGLTKPLGKTKFDSFLQHLGLCKLPLPA
jgi:hypothetical protein